MVVFLIFVKIPNPNRNFGIDYNLELADLWLFVCFCLPFQKRNKYIPPMKPTVSIYIYKIIIIVIRLICHFLYKKKIGKPIDWLILYA